MKTKKITLSDVYGKPNNYHVSVETPYDYSGELSCNYLVSPFEFDNHFLVFSYPAEGNENATLKDIDKCIAPFTHHLLGIANRDNIGEKTYSLALQYVNRTLSAPDWANLINWVFENQTARGKKSQLEQKAEQGEK